MKINPFDIGEFRPATDCYLGAALIGGAASLGSGLIGARAASSAADKQAQAQQQAIAAQTATQNRSLDMQQNIYDQNRGLALPYINSGANMLPALQGFIDPTSSSSPLAALMRLTTPGPDMNAALAQTPGFQFTQLYGMKGINNALAARGLAGPGGALARAGADYSSGLASKTWGDVVGRLLSTYQAGVNPLQNLVNTGAGSTAALAGAGASVGGNMANSLTSLGNAQAAGFTGIGNAQAAGTLGAAGAIGGAVNNIGQYGMLANLIRNNGGGGGGGGGGVYGGGSPYATSADAGMPWGGMQGSGGFNFIDAAAGY